MVNELEQLQTDVKKKINEIINRYDGFSVAVVTLEKWRRLYNIFARQEPSLR